MGLHRFHTVGVFMNFEGCISRQSVLKRDYLASFAYHVIVIFNRYSGQSVCSLSSTADVFDPRPKVFR